MSITRGFSKLPNDVLAHVLTFSEPTSVARTNRSFYKMWWKRQNLFTKRLITELELEPEHRHQVNIIYYFLKKLQNQQNILRIEEAVFLSLSEPARILLRPFYINLSNEEGQSLSQRVFDLKEANLKTIKQLFELNILNDELLKLCQSPNSARLALDCPYIRKHIPHYEIKPAKVYNFDLPKSRKSELNSIMEKSGLTPLYRYFRKVSHCERALKQWILAQSFLIQSLLYLPSCLVNFGFFLAKTFIMIAKILTLTFEHILSLKLERRPSIGALAAKSDKSKIEVKQAKLQLQKQKNAVLAENKTPTIELQSIYASPVKAERVLGKDKNSSPSQSSSRNHSVRGYGTFMHNHSVSQPLLEDEYKLERNLHRSY